MPAYLFDSPIDRLSASHGRLDDRDLAFVGTDSGAMVQTDDPEQQWVATCRDENVADFLVQAHSSLPTLMSELAALRHFVADVECLLHDQPDDAAIRKGLEALVGKRRRVVAADQEVFHEDAKLIVGLLQAQVARYLDALEKIAAGADETHPEWCDGLLEVAIDEAAGLLSLRDYVVTVIDGEDGVEVLYRCQAEDRDHAVELAEKAHPDGEIAGIARNRGSDT